MSTPETLYPLILESIAEGVFTVDADFRITYLNEEAERITGIRREDALGHRCYQVLRGTVCQTGCPLKRSMETGEPQRDVQVSMLNAHMDPIPIRVTTAVMRGPSGELIGGVEIFRDVSEIEALRKEVSGVQGLGDMVGASPPMRELFRFIPDVAASDASVLIQGASGTGKELVAQAIHERSTRREGPFVRVNCGALPDTLLESELFGHVRGAFTDARRDRPGRFRSAHGGTLFLDEVGELSPAFQVKLLRALQEGEVQPLGGTETITVDVRVIAATNRDLAAMLEDETFREDLYYRLCVVPIRIPPLAERREDVVPLVEHFISRYAARTGKPIRGISGAALHCLVEYDYPGNVRELINIIERAFVLCHGEQIEPIHLPTSVVSRRSVAAEGEGERAGPGPRDDTDPATPDPALVLPRNLKPSERRALALAASGEDASTTRRARRPTPGDRPEILALVELLNANGWNRKATADQLGISRSTLWRRMRDYGLI